MHMPTCPIFQSMSPWSALQVRADRIPWQTLTCNTSTQDCPPRKRLSWQGQAQLLSGCMHDVHHNENCKTCCTSHLMIFKSSQPHLYLNVVHNDLEGGASFRWCSKSLQDLGKQFFKCLQETGHCSCSFNACLPRPQTSILALAPWTCPLQKLNGLQVPRQQQRWFVLSRQSQLWKRGSRRLTMVNSDRAMPCRSIGHTSRSLHPPVRSNSKFLRRSIRLSMLACNSHLREKLKSPKPSLREDISPPRYTANIEKCSESQSGSASVTLCLAPFRTLTHALPVFMQVIYYWSADT